MGVWELGLVEFGCAQAWQFRRFGVLGHRGPPALGAAQPTLCVGFQSVVFGWGNPRVSPAGPRPVVLPDPGALRAQAPRTLAAPRRTPRAHACDAPRLGSIAGPGPQTPTGRRRPPQSPRPSRAQTREHYASRPSRPPQPPHGPNPSCSQTGRTKIPGVPYIRRLVGQNKESRLQR